MSFQTQILQKVKNPDREYRPVAFWFLNHAVREKELSRQIAEMAEKGFGGIMIHARIGLRSGYLDAEWERIVDFCLKEAVRRDLDVWLYDELNYPSGPAGGKLYDTFPDCAMQCLKVVFERTVDSGEQIELSLSENTIYALATGESGVLHDLLSGGEKSKTIQWRNDGEDTVSILVLDQVKEFSVYDQFPDYFDKEAMKEFIRLSYEWYAERFGDYFGSVIKGEFTDNSCASFGDTRRSVPWSKDFPERFDARTGEKLENILPGVFLDLPTSKSDRLIFWRFINDEYLDTFIKPVDESCRRNGIASTGHYCIEDGKSEHIRQLGNRFDQKRNQGLPAVDMLGKADLAQMEDLLRMGTDPGEGDRLSISIPGTSCPAYFTGGSRTMCECLGLAGKWSLDLAEIKRVTGLLAVLGIDLFVPHGIYYSINAQRKWEAIPDHFHNPIWEHYREWTDWIAKICQLIAYGERTSEIALLYPATSQQAYMALEESTNGNKHNGAICAKIDMTYRAAGNYLLENNFPYEIIDETYIQNARIEEQYLVLDAANGKSVAFTVMVLPHTLGLEKKTFAKLREWRQMGGRIVGLNAETEFVFDTEDSHVENVDGVGNCDLRIDFEDESDFCRNSELYDFLDTNTRRMVRITNGNSKIVSKEWSKDGHRFCLLHNISRDMMKDVEIEFAASFKPVMLDLETAEMIDVAEEMKEGGYLVKCDFQSAESRVFVSGADWGADRKCEKRCVVDTIEINGNWSFSRNKPNAFPLRECHTTVEENSTISTYNFEVDHVPVTIGLALDEEMLDRELVATRFFEQRFYCFINGERITDFSPGNVFDSWIFEADIAKNVKKGKNELKIVKKSILGDYRGDSPILFGDFTVENNKIIKTLSELALGDWAEQGFPFYAGSGIYSKTIELPPRLRGQSLILDLGNVGNSAEVRINGQKLGVLITPPWRVDITSLSQEDKLFIEIIVANTAASIWGGSRKPSGLLGPVGVQCYETRLC